MENTYNPLKQYLSEKGQAFSQDNLKALASSNSMNNFTGTDEQNKQLSSLLNLKPTTNTSTGIVAPNTITPNAINIPKTIALDSLNTQAYPVPVPQQQPTIQANQPIAPVNQADQILKDTTVADTEAQKQAMEMSTMITNLIPELSGQAKALTDAQKVQGVDKLNTDLQKINSQIKFKVAEMEKDSVSLAMGLQQIEDKPIAMEFITGQQASLERQAAIARSAKASEVTSLNARALALQDNIGLAMKMAQQSVDEKYAPIKEAINLYQMQLDALQPILSKDEKKQATQQELRTKLALQDLQNRQDNDKEIQKLVINATGQGAPKDLADQAAEAKTPAQAAAILGSWSGDYWKIQQVKAAIAKTQSETAKNYASAKVSASGGANGENVYGKPVKVTNSEIVNLNDAITAKNSLISLIDSYNKNIDNYGTYESFGEAAGQKTSLKTSILLAMKSLEKTGALDNGTIQVLAGTIPDNEVFATSGGAKSKLDTLKNTIEAKTNEYINSYKGTTAESDPRTSRAFVNSTQLDSWGNTVNSSYQNTSTTNTHGYN